MINDTTTQHNTTTQHAARSTQHTAHNIIIGHLSYPPTITDTLTNSSTSSVMMSVTHTVLKVLIAYYVVQILYVHYHTYKLQNIPPPTPMNNKTVTVVKKETVFQARDYLTQEQLFLIQESVKESFDHNGLPDVSNYPVKLLTEEFNDNLRTINALSAN
eukprot:scaffold25_cov162-Chaetoceros_neogracile.AAC.3